jgi:hypothetical protein
MNIRGITFLEGNYKDCRVVIRVAGDPQVFINEHADAIGFVHCFYPDGEVKLIQVRRGDIWGIRIAG